MGTDPNNLKRIAVVVSDDKLKAWIRLGGTSSPGHSAPSVAALVGQLQAAKIALTEAVHARVTELAEACARGQPPDGDFLVAEGTASQNAEDGRFEWAPELQAKLSLPKNDSERVDYFSHSEILTVSAGAVIGRLLPPKDSVVGVDVYGGQRIPRKRVGVVKGLGPGLRLAAEGSDQVVAETDGRVAEEGGRIRLFDVLKIGGDVDFNSGSVEANVDVEVGGTVRTNFHVRTTKSLTVGRAIEAADIVVGGAIRVRGGIFGHGGRGRVEAGGGLGASFINETTAHAGGDIQFVKEILNSRIRARGRVLGPRGTIIGGEVYAREGVEVNVIGSEACVNTCVTVGMDVNVLRRARQMERQVKELHKSAAQIRETMAPLMANLKRLNPEQRERVTELMAKAGEIDTQVDDLNLNRERMVAEASASGTAYVLVQEMIHPGTRLIVEAREVSVNRPIHGPVRIELRKVDKYTQVAVVNQLTASVTILPAMDVDLDKPPTDGLEVDKRNEKLEAAVNRS